MRWYDRCWVLGGEVGDWRSYRGAGGVASSLAHYAV